MLAKSVFSLWNDISYTAGKAVMVDAPDVSYICDAAVTHHWS